MCPEQTVTHVSGRSQGVGRGFWRTARERATMLRVSHVARARFRSQAVRPMGFEARYHTFAPCFVSHASSAAMARSLVSVSIAR
jgi:hypothetical protein